jgi:hypothetical protein
MLSEAKQPYPIAWLLRSARHDKRYAPTRFSISSITGTGSGA